MRIQFILPRFHTNKRPLFEAFAVSEHEIKLTTQKEFHIEDHTGVSPEILGYGGVSKALSRTIFSKDKLYLRNYGFPRLRKLLKSIQEFNPDVIVARQYYAYSAATLLAASYYDIPVLFWGQPPMYGGQQGKKYNIINSIHKLLYDSPLPRLAWVQGDPELPATTENSYYVPLAMSTVNTEPSTTDDEVRLISVGKLNQPRKNHLLLLKTLKNIIDEHPSVRLTIVGSLTYMDGDYFNKIRDFVAEHELHDRVEIKKNVPYKDLRQEYAEHDLFVIPSKREGCSVSLLEAMAAGLPVICSDTNGAQWYLRPDENGFVFRSDSVTDLHKKIRTALQSDLEAMGRKSIDIIEDNHDPEMIRQEIVSVIHENVLNVEE